MEKHKKGQHDLTCLGVVLSWPDTTSVPLSVFALFFLHSHQNCQQERASKFHFKITVPSQSALGLEPSL